MSLLGDYFHTERKSQLLTLGQLAQKVTHKNATKVCRRLYRLEHDGTIKLQLLRRVAAVLGIEWNTVERLLEEDRQEKLQADPRA